MSGYPDGNPKTAMGALKVPLHLVPPSATFHLAMAFKDGAAKYGPYNWRDKGVSASVYIAAAMRHLDAYRDREELSRDALVHHLGHVMACCAIILDAASVGKLNDDRPPTGAAADLQAQFAASKALDSVSMAPPNCDGLSARDVRAPHPMASEEIRDHDERLAGGEDRL